MASLRDLHTALMKLSAAGGGARVYFYVATPEGGMRHGYFLVVDKDHCQVFFEGMAADAVLAQLPRLHFVKVDTLGILSGAKPDPDQSLIENAHVLNMIDPDLHSAAQQTAVQQASTAAPAQPREPAAPARAPEPDPRPAPRGGLANFRLRDAAVEAMEPFLGNGAAQKVDSITKRISPFHNPLEFLAACESSVAMIVGRQKAAEVFKPIRERAVG